MRQNRDYSIDILRSFALIAIILVHCHPDDILVKQMTEFNVPMMVFLSGVSYSLSSKNESYGSYCWKRLKRLVFPAWIFVWGYGCVHSIIASHFMAKFLLFNSIFYTYWYVWIIRVFFIIALLAPLFKRLVTSESHKRLFLYLAMVGICYEIVLTYVGVKNQFAEIVAEIIPYSMFFILGMVNTCIGEGKKLLLIFSWLAFAIIACLFYADSHQFIVTDTYKYPPRLYYTSFAIGIISIFWMTRKRLERLIFSQEKVGEFFQYIGSHTIWIYFWHIPFVEYFESSDVDVHYAIKFSISMSMALLLAYAQECLIKRINFYIQNENVRKMLKTLFVG